MSDKNSTSDDKERGSEHATSRPEPIKINRPRLSGSGDFQTPTASPNEQRLFLVPSPIVTRRTRTLSACRHYIDGPTHRGICKYFSRSKGHGFVDPGDDSGDLLFMHISDIDSDYIPLPGDILEYKKSPLPPKNDKFQAVDVHIVEMDVTSGKHHERWDSPAK